MHDAFLKVVDPGMQSYRVGSYKHTSQSNRRGKKEHVHEKVRKL